MRDVLLTDGHEGLGAGNVDSTHRDGHLKQCAILATASGFGQRRTIVNGLPERLPCGDPAILGHGQLVDRRPDRFLGRIAEHRLRSSIPGTDPSLERERNQRVRRFVEQQFREGDRRAGSVAVVHLDSPRQRGREPTSSRSERLPENWDGSGTLARYENQE